MQNDAKSSITWWGKGFLKELQNTACLFLRFQGKTVKEGNEPSFKYPATCFPSAIFESGSCPWKYWDKKFAFIDIFISKARIGWHIICIYVTNCQNHPRNPRFMLSKLFALWKEKYALGSCNLLFCKTKNYVLVNASFFLDFLLLRRNNHASWVWVWFFLFLVDLHLKITSSCKS